MHAVKHCDYGPPCLTRKTRIYICVLQFQEERGQSPLYLHAEEEPQRQKMNGVPSLTYRIAPVLLSLWANRRGLLPGLGLGGLRPSPPPSCLGATAQLSQSVAMATGSLTRLRGGEKQNGKVKRLNFPFQRRLGGEVEGTSLGLKSKAFRAPGELALGFLNPELVLISLRALGILINSILRYNRIIAQLEARAGKVVDPSTTRSGQTTDP